MSYILDALNKSEQERQQRENGISLQAPVGVPHEPHRAIGWAPWLGAAIVVAAAIVFVAVYWFMRGTPTAPDMTPQAASAPASPVPATPGAAVAEATRETTEAVNTAQATAPSAAAPKPASTAAQAAPLRQNIAAAKPSDSVTSLYQRKGLTAEQAKQSDQQVAPESAVPGASPADADVKTFASDETATVRADNAMPEAAPANPKANLKALEAALQKEREAELAAKVQAELESLQERDNEVAERKAAAVATTMQPVEEPVAPLATELPAAVQQRIPSIEFGAHVYAGKTGNGFVILNGKKRYAGDTVAPGLTVERVTEEGVIMNLGGTRFRLESMRSWFN